MMNTLRTFVATTLMLVALSVPATAHNIFATMTEIEWNDQDQSLEVIMQMHAEHLEARLSLDLGERLNFLNDSHFERLEAATAPLIAKHLEIIVNSQPVILSFLGLEFRGDEVFLYLETELESAPRYMEVMNSLFLDDLPGQVNSVMATVKGERQAADITSAAEPAEFNFD
ncbi:MAG: hypothetical protein HWE08_05780 [Alphaproteobacteria bacterium]|nr:hypothetical protein [Alphaproteobacteria bacterium]